MSEIYNVMAGIQLIPQVLLFYSGESEEGIGRREG